MGCSLLQAVEGRRGSATLDHLNGIVVFTSAISTALITLMLKLLLGLSIGKAQHELYPILSGNVMEFRKNLFGYFAGFESDRCKR